MRTFKLIRKVDVSGVSGTGEVAEGVVFSDGQCILSWHGQHHSINVYPNLEDMIFIHGHEGSTEAVFDEPKPTVKKIKAGEDMGHGYGCSCIFCHD